MQESVRMMGVLLALALLVVCVACDSTQDHSEESAVDPGVEEDTSEKIKEDSGVAVDIKDTIGPTPTPPLPEGWADWCHDLEKIKGLWRRELTDWGYLTVSLVPKEGECTVITEGEDGVLHSWQFQGTELPLETFKGEYRVVLSLEGDVLVSMLWKLELLGATRRFIRLPNFEN